MLFWRSGGLPWQEDESIRQDHDEKGEGKPEGGLRESHMQEVNSVIF